MFQYGTAKLVNLGCVAAVFAPQGLGSFLCVLNKHTGFYDMPLFCKLFF